MSYVQSSIIIKGDKFEIYKLAKNMEEFPSFMPDVKSVKVIERIGDNTITEWSSELEGAPISWKELDEFNEKKPEIKYKLLEGDLDKFEGEWRFEEVAEGVKVTLTVDFDFGMPSLEKIVGPILKIKVENNCQMMLQAIKKRLEEGGE